MRPISLARAFVLASASLLPPAIGSVSAQGQDGKPWERDLMVLAEMLPGRYDNANQQNFDERLRLPEAERHERMHVQMIRVDLKVFGTHVFYRRDYRNNEPEKGFRQRIYALVPDDAAQAVRMKVYFIDGEKFTPYKDAHLDLTRLSDLTPEKARVMEGCDIFWKRESGQFRGRMADRTCKWEWPNKGAVYTDFDMMLSATALWQQDLTLTFANGPDGKPEQLTGNKARIPYKMNRAREFECYCDIPGVSGGRDIPFIRYEPLKIHDVGGTVNFETRDAERRSLGLTLRNVDWAMNNEKEGFTRNSLVLYVTEKLKDGSTKLHSYAWTEPRAERIGMNMQWMLVNCYMESNRNAKPVW
jgi:hypothetical protein